LAAQAAGQQRAAAGEGAAAEHAAEDGAAAEDAAGDEAAAEHAAWEQAKALRDLLKFEFFFPGRDDFERELRGELGLITAGGVTTLTARVASDILGRVDLVIAPLVLRPFIDAYLVLADRLAAAGSEPIAEADEVALLDDALRVGEQWELERRIASAESVSLELFRTALRLARHRGLLAAPPAAGEAPVPATTDSEPYAALPTLSERREAFRTELQHLAAHLDTLAHLAESRRRQPADAPATPHLVDAAARLVGTIGAGDEEAAADGDVR
ncbi:MAG: hypothetical protein WAR57_10070, partial [Candidatus Phosphoribacter sp.]